MAVEHDDTVASSLPTLSGTNSDVAETVANRYRVVRWLGGGGMGRVYEVEDTELGERVALKVLRSGLSEEAIERFRREVRLTRRIQHRNVARMFDIGEHNGDRFLTMELVDGTPLTHALGHAMSWERIQSLSTQLCAGLAAAHRAGVIHRDLKPDNVLVERETDRAVITDFGIARSGDDASVTQVGVVIGTPRYMAPEQLAGNEVDARADLFSLGVMLYELASGKRPWGGDNAITIAVAQVTQPMRTLEPVHVPQEFVDVVVRCLALEPGQRPATAEEIGDAIAACVHTSRPARTPPRTTLSPPLRTPTPTSSPAGVSEETAITVLPFVCGAADDYLAEGLTEDLIDTLSTTPSLRVRPAGVGRSRTEHDARTLGHQLGVDHVVTGSIRRTPSGLRVSARLIGVADGFQIWAHRVDCTEAEVLAVSELLAKGIAGALSTRAVEQTSAIDQDAVDYYLRARAELRRFWGEHAGLATELLEKAAAIAPSSQPILSALAFASVARWTRSGKPEMLPRATAAVQRALATGYGESFLASSNLKFNLGDLHGGGYDLGVALARAPMSAQAHEAVARILVEVDAVGEALRHFDMAVGLDAGRAQMLQADLARVDALRGDWAMAERRFSALVNDPDLPIMQFGSVIEARIALWRGDLPRVFAAVSRLPARFRGGTFDLLGVHQKWATTGEFDAASWVAHIDELSRDTGPQRTQLAAFQRTIEVSAAMQQEAATEYGLRAASAYGLIDVLWTEACPVFAPFKHARWYGEVVAEIRARAAGVLAAFRAAR